MAAKGLPDEPAASFLPQPATRPLGLHRLLPLIARRQGGRRAVSGLVAVLLLAGTGFFAAPAITDVIARWHQHELLQKFHDPQLRTEFRTGRLPIGSDLTELSVDNSRVHINVLVVQGTTPAALENGAGHYTQTPLPCYRGNVAIAGHRTTYGRPFNKIDQMQPGDTVTLLTPIGQCVYRVVPVADHPYPWIVAPTDEDVVSQQGLRSGHWLTLTSCNPPGSAATRIVVRLKMVSSTVREPASALAGQA